MTFFVTSVGMGNGADLNGLIGADAHCQSLAVAAGAGDRTWHAYLSAGPPIPVNARGRIGRGPWHNHAGTRMIADDLGSLHGDTLDEARLGNQINQAFAMTENGDTVPSLFGRGAGEALEHDILTGSQPDGRAFTDGEDHTCSNWTSSVSGEGSAAARPFRQDRRRQWIMELIASEPRLQPRQPDSHRWIRSLLLLRHQLGTVAGRSGGGGRGAERLRGS